jgi:hypothetical protein
VKVSSAQSRVPLTVKLSGRLRNWIARHARTITPARAWRASLPITAAPAMVREQQAKGDISTSARDRKRKGVPSWKCSDQVYQLAPGVPEKRDCENKAEWDEYLGNCGGA